MAKLKERAKKVGKKVFNPYKWMSAHHIVSNTKFFRTIFSSLFNKSSLDATFSFEEAQKAYGVKDEEIPKRIIALKRKGFFFAFMTFVSFVSSIYCFFVYALPKGGVKPLTLGMGI